MLLTSLAFLVILTVLLSLAYHAGRASRPPETPPMEGRTTGNVTPNRAFIPAPPIFPAGMVRYMGTTVENTHIGPHFSGGVFKGYVFVIHQSSIGLDLWSDDATYPQLKAAVNAARDGTDADLDAAGGTAFGSAWWTDNIVTAGRRGAARQALKHYVPPALSMP